MEGISQHRRWLNRYEYFLDEYEYYNFDPAATTLSHSRKGRSKKEASLNTNRSNPAGHERKVLTKLQNAERKKKMCNIKTTEKWSRFVDFHGNYEKNWPKPVAYTNNENWINWMKTSEPWKMPRCCSELCSSNVVQNIIENRDPSGFWYWNVFLGSKSIACSYFAWSCLSYFEVNSGHKM